MVPGTMPQMFNGTTFNNFEVQSAKEISQVVPKVLKFGSTYPLIWKMLKKEALELATTSFTGS